MARTADAPFPTVVVDTDPAPAWMRGRLVIALERLPQAAYVWDDDDPDVVWDDLTPERVWDAPFVGEGFTDVWCDHTSLTIIHGEADPQDMYRTSACQLELRDPGDGRYRTRTPDGRLVYYAPGRRLAVWWLDPAGVGWWMFSGAIATWRERLDNSVAIEAFSAGWLGRSPGVPWTAGAAGQFLIQRVASVLAAPAVAYTGRSRVDVGDVTLSVPAAADVAALDVLRQAAWSDGGIVYTDADDTLIVRDRRWRNGRIDQGAIPILTDNVCDAGVGSIVVWEPETADAMQRMAGTVRLTNAATPIPLVATAAGSGLVDPAIVFQHPGIDLWQTQPQGDALAAHIAAERSTARMALARAGIYLHDARFDYWRAAVDLRLGDRVRFVHDDVFTPPGDVYDITAIATTVRHLVTPNTWVVELATSPAVDYTAVELWDWTRFTWDDPNPLAVWR